MAPETFPLRYPPIQTTLIALPYHFLVTPINSLLCVLQEAFSLSMQSLAIFWGKKLAPLLFP